VMSVRMIKVMCVTRMRMEGDVCDKDEDGGILMMGVMTMQLRGIVKVMSDHND